MKFIARLLHVANSNPADGFRKEFYSIKRRLLLSRAKHVGRDLQSIPGSKCFSCHGTGWWESYSGMYEDVCNRCYDGWYKRPFWVYLEKYEWHGFKFHVPGERIYEDPSISLKPNIEGYIDHCDYGDRPEIAFVWLCLLTMNFKLAYRWFASESHYFASWHPFFVAKMVVAWIMAMVKKYNRCKCKDCGQLARIKLGVCRRCHGERERDRTRANQVAVDADIPF
jgi:hypothetical protein